MILIQRNACKGSSIKQKHIAWTGVIQLLMQPLILTIALDYKSQEYFTQLRQKHFPPERNHLEAHLTLFHQLPPNESQITDALKHTSIEHAVIDLQVTEVKNIGSGVAYKIESAALMQLHRALQQQWQQWLIPQDQHKLWPHITIQNKVDHQVAASLREQLEDNFEPFSIQAVGLNLWEYLGGPWRFIESYEFKK